MGCNYEAQVNAAVSERAIALEYYNEAQATFLDACEALREANEAMHDASDALVFRTEQLLTCIEREDTLRDTGELTLWIE